ncbi:MAG: hypothetical protein IKY44_06545 [Clostridia bacterium]|nr:hypothetical protein [Clostridia bacterium]
MFLVIKKEIKSLASVALSTALCLMIIAKSDVASAGIISGLKACAGVIIPSLFPFMVVSSFIIKSGIYVKIGRLIGRPLGWIFNLPPQASGAILMGFVGGYPVGMAMTAELFELGVIDRAQARRMSFFCVNAGPAFVVSAVGGSIFQSKVVGYILFGSVVLSSLTVGIVAGIISRIKGEKAKKVYVTSGTEGICEAFVSATQSGARAILSICIWVVTFGAILAFVRTLNLPNEMLCVLCGLLEVTSGCASAAGVLPISLTAAFISFSGICITLQLLPQIKAIGLKAPTFLLSRLVCAMLTFIYCEALTRIFPISAQVFSNGVAPLSQGLSVSIPATISLILTCIVLIFDVDRKKKMC